MVSATKSGTSKESINQTNFKNYEIPYFDIERQNFWIEKLKNTLGLKDLLEDKLVHQQTLLKKLRQQILQEAIEGKLTAEWRTQNTNVEPARELLKRIAAEKVQLVKDKKIKAQKPLPPITDKEKPFDLPQGWEWCRLDQLIYESPKNGYSPKTVDFQTGTKTLKLGATTSGKFDATQIKYVNKSIPKDSFLWIKSREILIQRGNSIDFVGVSAIYYGEGNNFIYPDLMMKLKPVNSISEVYLHHVLMSGTCREYFRKNAVGAQKSMPKINQAVVSCALVPLCSEPEQQAIVTKVEKLLALCDQLEAQITQNKTHAEQLMQAVLKEAFANNEAETKKSSPLLPFKPKGSDYYKRTLLAAEIVDQLKNEPTLGHLKLQKLIYLCQKSENMQLPVNFLQQAAGPYDPQMARSLDKQFYIKGWFQYQTGEMLKYKPLPNAGAHRPDFQKYFSDVQTGIQAMINLFRNAKSDHIEIVATLYACWEKMIENNELFSNETLINRFYLWSKEKNRFSEEVLKNTISWMKDNYIFPNIAK